MFDALSNRLTDVFDRLKKRGALSDSDVDAAMRDIRVALLEADVTTAGRGAQQTPTKNRTLSAAGIKNLQRLLGKLDIDPGPQDGVLGDKTTEAIRLYQRFAGLPVDGKATLELLLDLRQVVDAMSADRPAASVPTDVR